PDGSVTFTATGTLDAGALGDLVNTATVTAPAGVTDPEPLNDSATDTDNILVTADLSITKDDGSSTAIPGVFLNYTPTAINHGPSDAPGATVSDDFPDALEGVSWSCTPSPGGSCTAAGSGDLADVVSIPAGGSVTYIVGGTPDVAATGTLSNTATIAAPSGVTELDVPRHVLPGRLLYVPSAVTISERATAAASPLRVGHF
ncbi:MAG: DUF11 domain-containing protein, partial [bacterium]|nr:DUF11 domain-containing protein [bacterium]